MGAQTTHNSAGSSTSASSRRAKPFIMDDQTRFLYLILKQLDLKTINWQHVADDLGIKNGHAARMRWSRFRCHVEGVSAVNNRKKDDRKVKSVNAKNAMPTTKRSCIESGQDEENDAKRLKTEQGWAAIPASYGQPLPPPYYPLEPSYATLTPQHPSFGSFQPPPLFGLQSSGPGGFQTPPLSQAFGPVPSPLVNLNPSSVTNSRASAIVKAESDPLPAPQLSVESRDEPNSVVIKSERGGGLNGPSGSAPSISTASIDSPQRDQAQQSKPDSALPSADASVGCVPASQDASCMAFNDRQQSAVAESSDPSTSGNKDQDKMVKQERGSLDGILTEPPFLVAEVSKEDFAKAVDAEAAARAQVDPIITECQTASPRPGDPSSPEIPLATVKAQALLQQAASADPPSSAQVQSAATGADARSISHGPSSCEKSPPPKPRPSATANLPVHQSSPSSGADLLPPTESGLPRVPVPPILPASATLAPHCFNPPYALPNGSYFHPLFPNHQPHHATPHPYWHPTPFVHMNNSSPSPYPLHRPPICAPSTVIPDWNDSPHPFSHPAFPQAAALHEYGRHAMSAPGSQTNYNLGTLITAPQTGTSQNQDQVTPVARADMADKGFKVIPDANMDMLVPSIDDFDPLGFDFQLEKDTRTEVAGHVSSGPMEPQHVVPVSAEAGAIEHDGSGNRAETEKGKVGETG